MNKYIFIALITLTVTGCEEYLEPDFSNTMNLEYIKTNPKYAEGLLMNAYNNIPGRIDINQEAATDDAVINNSDNIYRNIATGGWRSDYNPFSVWRTAYESIAYINRFLSIVDEVEWSYESEWQNREFAKRLKGEAYGLRAYYYALLLDYHAGKATDGQFRGVPMIREALTVNENWEDLKRNSYDECFTMINQDLDSAIYYLPDNYENAPDSLDNSSEIDRVYGTNFRQRMSATIARMLKTRLYLQGASPAFSETNVTSWQEVADITAILLVKIGGLDQLSNSRIEYYLDVNSPDILWRKPSSNNSLWFEQNNFPPSLFGSGDINPSQNLIDAFPMENGYPINHVSSGYEFLSPYANRDPRLDAYIVHNGSELKFTSINTVNDPLDGINAVPEFSTRTGYYLKKHINPDVNLLPGSETGQIRFHTLMRATEAFLIYAEAANEAFGPDGTGTNSLSARQVMQALRMTAGIEQPDKFLAEISDKDSMRELIKNERRLELCFEGFRFKDIRRWKDYEKMNAKITGTPSGGLTFIDVESRNFQDHMIYFPIPYEEVQKGLLQNEGWN